MKQDSLLRDDEVTLRAHLERVKNTTLLGTVICQGLQDESEEGYLSLLETLRSQGRDNPRSMEQAIGSEAMTLLYQGTNLLTAGSSAVGSGS